jgi:hypothetical protein
MCREVTAIITIELSALQARNSNISIAPSPGSSDFSGFSCCCDAKSHTVTRNVTHINQCDQSPKNSSRGYVDRGKQHKSNGGIRMSQDDSFLAGIRQIYRAARASDDGQRCAVAPAPDLRRKIMEQVRRLGADRVSRCSGGRAAAARRTTG